MMDSKKAGARMESGEIANQKIWQYIREMNGSDPDTLDLAALTDCRREYTYSQMYAMWERYARVFSALGITGENGSRAGVTGTASAEISFAFFGMNMTGASVSMIQLSSEKRLERLREVIEKEHITDLILTDYEIDARFFRQLLKEKDGMGIRNLIAVHIPVEGDFAFAAEKLLCGIDHRRMKEVPGALFMDDLLEKYSDHGICYAEDAIDEAAVIVHTSGTTEGVPKPVPLSDRAVNESLRRHAVSGKTAPSGTRMSALIFNNLYAGATFMGMLTPLANGGDLFVFPMIMPWLNFIPAVEHFRLTNIVCFSAMVDLFTMLPFRPDLSSVQTVLLVGVYTSAERISECRKFFRECGSDANILIGYGMSEAGCGLTLTDPDMGDDSVGYLLPGVKAKLWNEDEKRFYEPDGREHTGVLYVSTPSLSSGRLDGEVLFELDEIDGEKYLDTNDLFRIREDGALYCIGRANRFFLNEKGVKFHAGLIERAVSAQQGIRSCGLVPEFNKKTHDTDPALYVETSRPGPGGYRIIKDALEHAYIKDGLIEKTALPSRCVLTDAIPRTMTGKVDVHQIMEGNVHGLSYRIEGVFENEELKEIDLIPGGAGPEFWGCDCAFQ